MGPAGLKGAAGQTAEELLKVQHTTAVTAELQRMITDLEDPVHGEVTYLWTYLSTMLHR